MRTPTPGRSWASTRTAPRPAKVTGVPANATPDGPQIGDIIRVKNDELTVQTIKAKILGRKQDKVGKLNKQQLVSVNNAIATLQQLNLSDEADKLTEARDLAMQKFDAVKDPQGAQQIKDEAIDLFRQVGEAVDEERGKNFKDGESFDDVADTLDDSQKARLQALDKAIGTTYTARHALGDKTVDAGNDQGMVKGGQSQVRLQAASQQLQQGLHRGHPGLGRHRRHPGQGEMAQPAKATVRDAVATQQGQNVLAELQPSTYQRLKSGLGPAHRLARSPSRSHPATGSTSTRTATRSSSAPG